MSAKAVVNTPEDQALKAASGALIRAVGGVEAAEGYSRPNFRRLSEYQRTDNDCFMPIDVVKDLEKVAHGTVGYPQVTRFLAGQAGYVLVLKPQVEVGSRDLHAALQETVVDSGKLHVGVIGALADNVCEPAEAKALIALADENAEAAVRMAALLRQIAGED